MSRKQRDILMGIEHGIHRFQVIQANHCATSLQWFELW